MTEAGTTHDIFTGTRVETFWLEHLNSDDQPIKIFDKTRDMTVTQNIDAKIRGGFKFTIQSSSKVMDYMQDRVKPWVMVNGVKWPLGVYLPSSPDVTRSAASLEVVVPCHDKTIILEQDKVPETFSLPAGTPVIEAVVDLITGTGETAISVTESAATSRTPQTWNAGTSVRDIINDLLQSVNYSTIWVDYNGVFRVEPYIPPNQKIPVRVFDAGEYAIHSPDWKRKRDISQVPNRVILISPGTDTDSELISVAENTDPNSDYSYQARGGRWVTRVYENVEAADQTTLDSLATRYLANATRAIAHLEVSHALVPLNPGDAVVFNSWPAVQTVAQVNEFSYSLRAGALVSAMWTEVNT